MNDISMPKNFSSTLTRLADGFGSKKLTLLIIMIRFTPKIGSPAQIDSALLIFYYLLQFILSIINHTISTYICQHIYVEIICIRINLLLKAHENNYYY